MHSFRTLSVLCVLAAVGGCDLLGGFFGGDDDAPPTRRPRDDRSEGEGEGAGEGEGEGEREGEGPIGDEDRPVPEGPQILSFTSSKTTIEDDDTAVLTIVVSDPDGVSDIVGALLIDPATDTILRPLSPAGTPGTFTAGVSWNDLSPATINFDNDGATRRSIRVRFIDGAGHKVSQSLQLSLSCSQGRPACGGSCGELVCPAEDDGCLYVENQRLTADDRCSVCNTGCRACDNGCACFPDNDSCSNNASCLANFAIDENDDPSIVADTCESVGVISHRADGFVSWRIGGVERPVDLRYSFNDQNFTEFSLYELLCDTRGVFSVDEQDLPAALTTVGPVMGLTTPCAPTTLAQVNSCDPLFSNEVRVDRAPLLLCNGDEPADENPVDGDVRLAAGTAQKGRVEIFFEGDFGTVCDDRFSNVDATVVCRQLGFSSGVAHSPGSTSVPTGPDSMPIHLDEVACSGSESRLDQCNSNGVGNTDCSHSEDVIVTCS